jgi:hypothetical protein
MTKSLLLSLMTFGLLSHFMYIYKVEKYMEGK